MYDIRNYGLGDFTRFIVGPPEIEGEQIEACPNCKCPKTFLIRVAMKDVPLLKPGKQVGRYIGCAACPWASPMMASSTPE